MTGYIPHQIEQAQDEEQKAIALIKIAVYALNQKHVALDDVMRDYEKRKAKGEAPLRAANLALREWDL